MVSITVLHAVDMGSIPFTPIRASSIQRLVRLICNQIVWVRFPAGP